MSKVRKVIFVIALIAFLVSATVLAVHFIKGYLEEKAFDDLEKQISTTQEDLKTDKGTVMGKYVDLYKKNDDIIGWLKINNTKVDYPVMQTQEDPEYYLRRNFEKEYKISGTPFLDAASDIFIPTSNWLIYGHNMNNGSMFADILEYGDQSFYEENKIFRFDTIYEEGLYEVVAAGATQIYPKDSDKFKYYNYPGITTEEEFNEYVQGVKELSSIDTQITPKYGDQLVTLSTCSYHTADPDDGRFFVVGRAIDVKEYYLKIIRKINKVAFPWYKGTMV